MRDKKKTILLVDDNEEGRSILETFLRSRGYEIIVASNGGEALQKLELQHVDLILSDVLMPIMDGFELVRTVRRKRETQDMPFILYSATYTGPEDEILAKKMGADRFFAKPYDLSTILTAIEEEIKGREKRLVAFEPTSEETELLKVHMSRTVTKMKMEIDRWRSIFDSMIDMIALVRVDGTIIQCNKTFLEFFKRGAKTIEGETCFKLIGCKEKGTEVCPLFRSLKSGSRESLKRSLEGRVFLVFLEPIKGPDGKSERFIYIMRDVTAEEEAKRALKESENQYYSIFEHAIDGIYRTTVEGKIILANPSFVKMLGYESFEEMSRSIRDVTYDLYARPEDRAPLLKKVTNEGMIKGFEVEFKKRDGSIIWVSINAHVVKDERGNILYIEGFAEDVTQRKRAQIELEDLAQRLHRSFSATVRALSSFVELKDPYTAGHQKRVSELAIAIAEEMGLSRDMIESIRIASSIHDIGKIIVPSEILNKPGKLLDIEMAIVRKHPEVAYNILKDAEMPDPIPEIVYEHHERLDGSGYPRGLKAEEIRLEARILAVADVVEAISSHRPYRAALGIDAASKEIKEGKDRLYDGQVVDACLKTLSRFAGLP